MNISSRLYSLRNLLLLTFFSVTFCFAIKILGASNILPRSIAYSDIPFWGHFAFSPGIPYLDKPIEYPVIIGLIMHVASRFNLKTFFISQYLLLALCALVTTFVLYRLAEMRGNDKKYLLLCWAIAPSMLWYSYYNWDVVAVMFTAVALYWYEKKKDTYGTIFLALGFATKFYPIFFLIPVLMQRPLKDWFVQGSIFVGTFLLLNGYFIINSFDVWYYIFDFHRVRGPNIDSVWNLVRRIFPALSFRINVLTLILFVLLYFYIIVKYRKEENALTWLLVLLAFLIANKVFSPQYVLWMLPFIVLLGIDLRAYYALEVANLAVLFATLNHHPGSVNEYLSAFFVLMRHIFLIYIFVRYLKAPVRSAPALARQG
jgi:uncharacterized membrane protein